MTTDERETEGEREIMVAILGLDGGAHVALVRGPAGYAWRGTDEQLVARANAEVDPNGYGEPDGYPPAFLIRKLQAVLGGRTSVLGGSAGIDRDYYGVS